MNDLGWLSNDILLDMNPITKQFLKEACSIGQFSPDPSTKNGAILRTKNHTLMSFNNFPDKIVGANRWITRSIKYMYVVHAESNVIAKAANEGIRTKSASLYVPFYSCHDCSKLIIQSGISKIYGFKRIMEIVPDRWKKSINFGIGMLIEAGVQCYLYDGTIGTSMLFDGKIVDI